MVVDIRYHLASIVAVFLALGLGILVGMSLSVDGNSERQEQWLASLERELGALRDAGVKNAEELRLAYEDRDRYRAYAAELGAWLMAGLLEGRKTVVVSLGTESAEAAGRVQALLEQAGAEAHRMALTQPETDTPVVADDGIQDALVLIVGEEADAYRPLVDRLAEASSRQQVRRAAVVLGAADVWGPYFTDLGIPYVSHFDTPPGELSLALLLAGGAMGGYGIEDGLSMWPGKVVQP